MGQLERYGLYVLCLVIFLILGVAIWGGDPQAPNSSVSDGGSPIRADGAGGGGAASPSGSPDGSRADNGPRDEFFAPDEYSSQGSGDAGRDSVLASMRRAARADANRGGDERGDSADDGSADGGSADGGNRGGATTTSRSYTVQPGESMAKIAQRELGSQRHTDVIVKLNPSVDPRKMKPGTVLRLPSRAALAARASRPSPTSTAAAAGGAATPMKYKVRDGDSPASIAKRFYGRDTRALANKIMKANGIRDARRLRAGKWIVIPPAGS